MRLAQPYAVLVGDESVATRFPPLEPIPSEVLEAYAQELRDRGLIPEVETRCGDLRDAIRRAQGDLPATQRPLLFPSAG